MVLVIGIRDQSNCNPDQNTTSMFLFKSAIFSLKNTKYPFMNTELIFRYIEKNDNVIHKFISVLSLRGLSCPRVAHIQSLIQEEIT